MNKQFKKFIDDTELYQTTRDFILDIERPKYNDSMSLQDYGAMCVAYEKLHARLKQRLDAVLIVGEEDVV